MSPIREDFAGQRQLRFRIDGQPYHLFKQKGESTHQVYLKVLVVALYGHRYPLEIDPHVDGKLKPHVASIDLTNEIRFWAHCGEINSDQVEHILKHTDAEEVVLVREAIEVDAYAAQLRKKVHYRYATKRLRILSFHPLEGWFDPEHVRVDAENYELYEF